jgi:glycosyltransferase involved in cell wall biosynthesis
MLHRIRKWDLLSSFRVDYFITNSDYVGQRVRSTYRREATTIHPNIDINQFELCEEKQDYYLASSRLVAYKKIDTIIEAFNQMPDKKLVVIGGGPNLETYKNLAKSNVEVMGYQPFDVLKEKMQHAKAFVFAADEDFGMIPIEAQSCGTPVIAYGHGGSLETVKGGVTGLFFNEQTPEAIIKAVNEFESLGNKPFDYRACREWAEGFSEERFKKEIKAFVEEKYKEFK